MNENLITIDNTFSRKELEDAFWLGYRCIGLLDVDASNRFNGFTSDIMAKRQKDFLYYLDNYAISDNWWKNLSDLSKQILRNRYFPNKNIEDFTSIDIKKISDEEYGKIGM